MSSGHDIPDEAIDRSVRDVPMPPGLAARVAPHALFSDEAIDRMLAATPVPHGLASRLRDGMMRRTGDAVSVDLDRLAAAAGVAVSPAKPHRDRARPRRRAGAVRWMVGIARDSLSVVTLLAGILGLFWAGMEVSGWLAPAPGIRPPRVAVQRGRSEAARDRPAAPRSTVADTGTSDAASERPLAAEVGRGVPDEPQAPAEPSPAPPVVLGAAVSMGPAEAAAMRTVSLFGEPRRRVPRDPGFDIAFEIQHGESPFVDLAKATALAVDEPPLGVRTDSFDALLSAVRSGRRAAAGTVRTEHILAAMPAAMPATDGGPAVSVHAVQSLRGRPESLLVEVAVTAPSLDDHGGPPLDATIILDRAAGGSGPSAWRSVCRGLAAIAGQLRSFDRLSVVVAGQEPRLVADRAAADEIRRVARGLEDDAGRGPADIDAALRLARAGDGFAPGRVIVVSRRESLERGHDEARDAFITWQRRAAAGATATDGATRHATFVLIDPAAGIGAGSGPGESSHVAADSVAIRRGMLEAVFGRSALALRQGSLRVEFDPQQVAAYRIVGHRHSAVDSVTDAPATAIDLQAGETARVVYEVVLQKKPGGDPSTAWLLRARFAGRLASGAGGTVSREVELRPAAVEPSSPLPSPHACELILAVEWGEAIAGSAHAAPARRNARAVTALVRAWQARGDVTPFAADLMLCVERPRSGRRPASVPFDVR